MFFGSISCETHRVFKSFIDFITNPAHWSQLDRSKGVDFTMEFIRIHLFNSKKKHNIESKAPKFFDWLQRQQLNETNNQETNKKNLLTHGKGKKIRVSFLILSLRRRFSGHKAHIRCWNIQFSCHSLHLPLNDCILCTQRIFQIGQTTRNKENSNAKVRMVLCQRHNDDCYHANLNT